MTITEEPPAEMLAFDVDTLTLRELMVAEKASGLPGTDLTGTTAGFLMLAVFVQRWRSSGTPPNWHELESLSLSDASSLISGS